MRTIPTRLALCVSMIALFAVSAAAAPPEGEGWESLFNGQDLSGWKIPEGDGGHWKVIDGVIDYDAQSESKSHRSLWSEASFGDFTVQVDWRIKRTTGLYPMPTILEDGSYKTDEDGNVITVLTPNADSGILLRGRGGAQANIWCWPIGSGEVFGYRINADMPPEVRAGVTPKVCADNPVGQWNTFVITMRGDRLTVELNGQTVIENAQLPGIPEEGPIALQHHGGFNKETGEFSPASSLMQFRNIYVKRLDGGESKSSAATADDDDGWADMFDGKSLDGWVVRSGWATYTVEDGEIVGHTAEKSPNTFLCTEKEYADFILEFEVMVDPELNSGVQIRSQCHEKATKIETERDGKKHTRTLPAGRVFGYQVEICTATRGVAGGIYDEARRGWICNIVDDPKASKAFKDGQWNKYRIECRGDSIKTFVNGVPCADLHDSVDAKGLIGLQVHGLREFKPMQVRWRNLRIKEL